MNGVKVQLTFTPFMYSFVKNYYICSPFTKRRYVATLA